MKNSYFIHGEEVWIELNRPKDQMTLFTVIDLEDLGRIDLNVKNRIIAHWSAYPKSFYAEYLIKSKPYQLSRLIMSATDNFLVDHANHDTLNNRKVNLRLVTHLENNRNQKGCRSDNSSNFIGVAFHKHHNHDKWRSYLQYDGKQQHLGYFDDKRQAAIVRDIKAVELYGEYATLNFPERLPEYQIITQKEIDNC